MKCKVCGDQIRANAKFCTGCGEHYAPADTTSLLPNPTGSTLASNSSVEDSGYFCSVCGRQNATGASFCRFDGTPIGLPESHSAGAFDIDDRVKSPPRIPFIAIGLGLISIAAVSVTIFAFKGGAIERQPSKPTISAAATVPPNSGDDAAAVQAANAFAAQASGARSDRASDPATTIDGETTALAQASGFLFGDGLPLGSTGQLYVRATINIRDRPTAQGSNIVGSLPRGTVLSGDMIIGEDGIAHWLQMSGTATYVSATILSNQAPPILASLAEREWVAQSPISLRTTPDGNQAVFVTLPAGTKGWFVGVTDNGFAEVVVKNTGIGVGYFLP